MYIYVYIYMYMYMYIYVYVRLYPEKRRQITDHLKLIYKGNTGILIKNNNQKITQNYSAKFRTKNWFEMNDDPRGMYNMISQTKFKTAI